LASLIFERLDLQGPEIQTGARAIFAVDIIFIYLFIYAKIC